MERPAAPSIRPPRSRSAPRCPVSWSSVRGSISRSASSSSSKSGLNWLTEAKPRKAIVEKAQTPQHSSRTSAIIITLRNRRFRYAGRLRVPSKPLAAHRKFALAASLSVFLQGTYALSRSMASNKLLRSNRRGKGVVPLTPVLEAHYSECRDVITGRGAKGAARQSRVRPLRQPVAARMITSL